MVINLANFRESDRGVAAIYLNTYRTTGRSNNAKLFRGGRTPAEQALFHNVNQHYIDLVEVKATPEGGDYSARVRDKFRYIIGRANAQAADVFIGIAKHTDDSDNDFDEFQAYPGVF